MELPRRAKGDEFVPAGQLAKLQKRVSKLAARQDVPTLFVYAFDYRTRVGPFVFFDKMLLPGAPLALGAALHSVGMHHVRLAMQQWSPNIRPSHSLINGKPPELLLISSMQIHSEAAYGLIRDAWSMGEDRPLILAGGSKAIYQPWDFFGLSDDASQGADVVVTGEEFVVLELLEQVLAARGPGESMRQGFNRARSSGALEAIPGLVYRVDDAPGPPAELMHTGIQRLVQDLDELPSVAHSLNLFEPRHRRKTLSAKPVSAAKLGRGGQVSALVTTHGCKFRCPYCPIPGYNQHTFRHKSPERLVEDMRSIHETSGIHYFFGTDDNLFNSRDSIEDLLRTMSRAKIDGKPLGKVLEWATEATEFDVWKNRDLLPVAREAGLRMIWFGVEDMTAELVKKGQSPEKTRNLFREMIQHGIGPMPMMMHHDGQPLYCRGNLYGLLNQVRFLRKSGAFSYQVTFLTPSIGSKSYEAAFEDQLVFDQIDMKPLGDHLFDGNHCIATTDDRPWRKQLNMMAAYATFYNPFSMLRDVFRLDDLWKFRMLHGFLGNLQVWYSLPRQLAWLWRLRRGPLKRATTSPKRPYPFRIPDSVEPELTHYHRETQDAKQAHSVDEKKRELTVLS